MIEQVEALSRSAPPHFKLDLGPNGSLGNAATAVPVLKRLTEYHRVAMFETPIPQHDILGNRQIRARIDRPLAMHFGSPPYATAVCAKKSPMTSSSLAAPRRSCGTGR